MATEGSVPTDEIPPVSSLKGIRRLSKTLDDALRLSFGRLGLTVARRPRLTILAVFVFVALTAIGFVRFRQESRGDRLWVPQSTDISKNDRRVRELYGDGIRLEQLVMVREGADLATKEELGKLLDVVRTFEDTVSDGGLRLSDLCLSISNGEGAEYCAMNSVLDLFVNPSDLRANDSFADAVGRGLDSLTDEQVKERMENGPFVTWSGAPLDKSEIIGGTSGSGATFAAQALAHVFIVNNNLVETSPGTEEDLDSIKWETAVRDAVGENTGDDNFWVLTQDDFDRALDDSLEGEFQWFALGYAFLIFYVVFMMGELFHAVHSRTLLGLAALATVGLAILSTFGVASLFGVFYGPVHTALPVLLLGLGADDAFVLVRTYDAMMRNDPTFKERSAEDRLAFAISSSGSAILITSVTNSFVFFISAVTPIPALRTFSIWAGLGVFFDFLYSITFFNALFYYDIKRQDANRCDFIPCLKLREEKPANCLKVRRGLLARVLSERYGSFLMRDAVRSIVVVLFVALFGASVYGASQLTVNFQYKDFYKTDSIQDEFTVAYEKFFEEQFSVSFYTEDVDFASREIQDVILDACDPQTGTVVESDFIVDGTVDCWLTDLVAFAENDRSALEGDDFLPTLKSFVGDPQGTRFDEDLVCTNGDGDFVSCARPEATKLFAARFGGAFPHFENSQEEVEGMNAAIDLAADSNIPNSFAHGGPFVFFELNAGIRRNAILLVGVSLLVVAVVATLLIGNPLVAFLVLVAIAFSTTVVLGVIYFWDVSLNSVSIINLSIAVGLTVDASAHFGRSFLDHAGARKERVKLALGDIGPAVVHGSVSTILAIVFLALSSSFIFQIFFRCLFTVLLSSLLHGLVFLPAILSFAGPPAFYVSEEERVEEEHGMLEKVLNLKPVVNAESAEDGRSEELSDD